MFRHVVAFRWSPASTATQQDAAVQALRDWAVTAREFGELTVGVDAGLVEGNAAVVVVGDFADAAAWRAYSADARHRELIDTHIAPIVAARTAVQHEL